MSEEKIRLKNETNREINQLNENNEKNIVKININDSNISLKYGAYKILLYNSKGDPLFVIGPDYGYFISILIMNLIYIIFFSSLFIYLTSFYISFFGVILNILQFVCLIICGIMNPGLPKKDMQNDSFLNNEPDRYERCNLCNFIIDNTKGYKHCEICEICCEGYDHHCPWTSKCVGRGNIYYFNGMLFMVMATFFYFIYAVITIDI